MTRFIGKINARKINAFLNNTTDTNFKAVKQVGWKRKVYQQTEVFRFGNPIVDEWEGKLCLAFMI